MRVELTPVGIASAASLLLSLVALVLAFLLLRVRDWKTGPDAAYFARWAARGYVGERRMKDVALEEVLIPGERENDGILKGRDRNLPWLWWVVVAQAVCVIVRIFAVADWPV